jgi:hypothetical protein
VNELRIVFRMTFVERFQRGPIALRGSSWVRDRHLRNGFLLVLPVFVIAIALIGPWDVGANFLLALGASVLANLA